MEDNDKIALLNHGYIFSSSENDSDEPDVNIINNLERLRPRPISSIIIKDREVLIEAEKESRSQGLLTSKSDLNEKSPVIKKKNNYEVIIEAKKESGSQELLTSKSDINEKNSVIEKKKNKSRQKNTKNKSQQTFDGVGNNKPLSRKKTKNRSTKKQNVTDVIVLDHVRNAPIPIKPNIPRVWPKRNLREDIISFESDIFRSTKVRKKQRNPKFFRPSISKRKRRYQSKLLLHENYFWKLSTQERFLTFKNKVITRHMKHHYDVKTSLVRKKRIFMKKLPILYHTKYRAKYNDYMNMYDEDCDINMLANMASSNLIGVSSTLKGTSLSDHLTLAWIKFASNKANLEKDISCYQQSKLMDKSNFLCKCKCVSSSKEAINTVKNVQKDYRANYCDKCDKKINVTKFIPNLIYDIDFPHLVHPNVECQVLPNPSQVNAVNTHQNPICNIELQENFNSSYLHEDDWCLVATNLPSNLNHINEVRSLCSPEEHYLLPCANVPSNKNPLNKLKLKENCTSLNGPEQNNFLSLTTNSPSSSSVTENRHVLCMPKENHLLPVTTSLRSNSVYFQEGPDLTNSIIFGTPRFSLSQKLGKFENISATTEGIVIASKLSNSNVTNLSSKKKKITQRKKAVSDSCVNQKTFEIVEAENQQINIKQTNANMKKVKNKQQNMGNKSEVSGNIAIDKKINKVTASKSNSHADLTNNVISFAGCSRNQANAQHTSEVMNIGNVCSNAKQAKKIEENEIVKSKMKGNNANNKNVTKCNSQNVSNVNGPKQLNIHDRSSRIQIKSLHNAPSSSQDIENTFTQAVFNSNNLVAINTNKSVASNKNNSSQKSLVVQQQNERSNKVPLYSQANAQKTIAKDTTLANITTNKKMKNKYKDCISGVQVQSANNGTAASSSKDKTVVISKDLVAINNKSVASKRSSIAQKQEQDNKVVQQSQLKQPLSTSQANVLHCISKINKQSITLANGRVINIVEMNGQHGTSTKTTSTSSSIPFLKAIEKHAAFKGSP